MDLNPVNLARRMAAAVLSRPSNPQTGTRLMYIGPNNAQVKVTPEIALMVSAVWACIDVVSSALSSSDWNVYTGFRAEDKQTFTPRDSLQYLLNTRPNEEMTAQSAKRAMLIAANSWGNGYAEIGRDMAGRVAALWPLAPDRVTLMRDGDGRLFYRVFNDGYETSWVDLDPRDVFHIRGPGMSGLLGDNPIAKAVQTIAMSVALDQFGASYFANNTQMGGVLETGGKLDDPTFARVRDQFNIKNKGARRAFGATPILEGGLKYTQLGTDADKAQLIEAKYQQVEEVCRWFRVPPHKIAHLLRATNNNIEHQGLEFSRDTLRPWKKEIEQEADFKLFPARGAARFLDIDIDWASEGDYKSRMEALQIGRGMGVFSANDVLRKLGENTIGAEGDIRIVNGAAIPLGKVGENYSAGKAPASQPATGTSAEQEETAE